MERNRRSNELGPTGRRVAENVRQIRERAGVSKAELAKRLAKIGRPINASGISKLESLVGRTEETSERQRRVDADDLAALALALGVAPVRLLMPAEADGEEVAITERVAVPAGEAWEWALGKAPIQLPPEDEGFGRTVGDVEPAEFHRRSLPRVFRGELSPDEIWEHQEALVAVGEAVQAAVKAGARPAAVQNYATLTAALAANTWQPDVAINVSAGAISGMWSRADGTAISPEQAAAEARENLRRHGDPEDSDGER
jgi:transcriptional regulator with XRE-family HTH domain